jgi:hypothetical protein
MHGIKRSSYFNVSDRESTSGEIQASNPIDLAGHDGQSRKLFVPFCMILGEDGNMVALIISPTMRSLVPNSGYQSGSIFRGMAIPQRPSFIPQLKRMARNVSEWQVH